MFVVFIKDASEILIRFEILIIINRLNRGNDEDEGITVNWHDKHNNMKSYNFTSVGLGYRGSQTRRNMLCSTSYSSSKHAPVLEHPVLT